MLELQEMIRVLHVVAYPIAFISFYVQDWQGGVFKVMKNDLIIIIIVIIIIIITRFSLLPQVFGQVSGQPILKLHEIIRMLHAVACPIAFILFDDRNWQGRVLKLMKNDHFQYFQLFARELCQNCTKKLKCHMQFHALLFFLGFMSAGRCVESYEK